MVDVVSDGKIGLVVEDDGRGGCCGGPPPFLQLCLIILFFDGIMGWLGTSHSVDTVLEDVKERMKCMEVLVLGEVAHN